LEVVEIRGNVPTRVRRVMGEDGLDAVLLAAAGLQRLGLWNGQGIEMDGVHLHAQRLPVEEFLPAAGQGAIAVECRAVDQQTLAHLAAIHHQPTALLIRAEREFLRLLGAGCQTPVGLRTWMDATGLGMAARVFDESDLGAKPLEGQAIGSPDEPEALASSLIALLGLQRKG
jgi:hydroxymethylbilane synthase